MTQSRLQTMDRVLRFTAAAEAMTGLALALVPSLVGRSLLGGELSGIAVPAARVAGIALIGLAIACWTGSPQVGMLTYSAAVTLYLAYFGIRTDWVGPLLWPAVALHAVLTLLLARSSLAGGKADRTLHRSP
jgi:hypothetical protein